MADFWKRHELYSMAPSTRRLAETLIRHAIKRSFKKNSVLISQDRSIKEIFFIVIGAASSHTVLHDGSEVWGNDFGPGDFIGHTALLIGRNSQFEVRAEAPITALSIPSDRFQNILETEAKIGKHAAQDIAARLRNMTERMVELSTLSAPERVCAELMRMARPIGIEEGKMIIRPSPIFSKLAKRVNSTRETVSRTVADLQRTGLVTREPGALRIEEPARLRRDAH